MIVSVKEKQNLLLEAEFALGHDTAQLISLTLTIVTAFPVLATLVLRDLA